LVGLKVSVMAALKADLLDQSMDGLKEIWMVENLAEY
jgi:hypothetical protein